MKKKQDAPWRAYSLIAVLIIIMLLSGCSLISSGSGDSRGISEFRGTQGLSMSFMAGAPQSEIYAPEQGSTTPFKAGIQLQNKGAYDIISGYLVFGLERDYLRIRGLDSDTTQVGAAGEKAIFSLNGRSQTSPYGEENIVIASMEALPLEPQSSQHRSTISATACYEYRTEFSEEVCVDTDVYNTRPSEKTCTVSDISSSGGQGAPVEVFKVEENIQLSEGSVRPQFLIHVRNAGKGRVFDKELVREMCSAGPVSYEDLNVVDVEEVRFSTFKKTDGEIKCYPERIKLRAGEGKTRCTLEPGKISDSETTTYTTPLFISLSYGYTETISKDIIIRNIMAE